MITFFDASALAKRYIREDGSNTVRRQLGQGIVAASRLSAAEIASALARRTRDGDLTPQDRDHLLRSLETDFERLYVVELTTAVTLRSWRLLTQHPLRASDALQLASCLELAKQLGYPVTFAAYDERLLAVAEAEGLELALR